MRLLTYRAFSLAALYRNCASNSGFRVAGVRVGLKSLHSFHPESRAGQLVYALN
jgi:hypothetical protein